MAARNGPKAVVTELSPKAAASQGGGVEGSTRDMIADLVPGSEQRRARVNRAAVAANIDDRVNLVVELSDKLAQSDKKMTNEQRQALAQKILTAQLSELREQLPKDQKVLAELLKELDDDLANLGGAFGEYQTPNESEKALVTAATALVDLAEGHVTLAKAKVAKLQDAWFFKESRTSAAQEEIKKAEEDLAAARLGVVQAQQQAKIEQEKRLLAADFSVHYDRFTARIKATCEILEKSRDGAWVNYEQVVEQLRVTYEDKTATAAAMEKLDAMIAEATQKLAQDQEVCGTLEAGSPERTELEMSISEQTNKIQELTGKRNEALAIFQAKERATPELETHRDTILAQYHVHRMNLASLRANSDSWRAAFDSRLEQMKGMASIDASSKIDSVGAAIAQDGAEKAAQTMVASVRQVVEMVEQHPERLAQLLDVQNTQHDGMAALMERMQVAMDRTKNRDGRADEHQPDESRSTATGS